MNFSKVNLRKLRGKLGNVRLNIQRKSRRHDYMMLSRYISDVKYYLGYGNRAAKHLYFGNESEHIAEMFKLYKQLSPKPVWITKRQLNKYRTALIFKSDSITQIELY
jgi:hypothetical protein